MLLSAAFAVAAQPKVGFLHRGKPGREACCRLGGENAVPRKQLLNAIVWIDPYSQDINSYAAFGQVEYRATDLLGFTLGRPIIHDTRDFNYSWYPYIYYDNSTTGGAVTRLTRPASSLLQSLSAKPLVRKGRSTSTLRRIRWLTSVSTAE